MQWQALGHICSMRAGIHRGQNVLFALCADGVRDVPDVAVQVDGTSRRTGNAFHALLTPFHALATSEPVQNGQKMSLTREKQ
jgi:hypothetical protein